jgi:acetyltransferase-like isoleucine patch superfamily enzyme
MPYDSSMPDPLAAALPARHRTRRVRTLVSDMRRLRHLRSEVRRYCLPPPPHQFGAFGRASVVVPPARVENPRCVHLGDGVVVHEHTWFAVVPFFDDVVPRVTIGDRSRIGRCCQLSVAGELVVEPDVVIGDFVQIGDTFHPWDVDDRLRALVRPSPVRIGRGAVVGSHVVVLPGVTIGEGAYVEHHTVVQHDVEPGQRVGAGPAFRRGRRRAGTTEPTPA